jgi:hypothetical protein
VVCLLPTETYPQLREIDHTILAAAEGMVDLFGPHGLPRRAAVKVIAEETSIATTPAVSDAEILQVRRFLAE